MRILVIHDRTVDIPVDVLRTEYNLEVMKNTFPKGSGIAIIQDGKEVDWSWPDYTVTVGTVEMGRHHQDAHIDVAGTDVISAIKDIINMLSDAQPAEEEEAEE